MLAVYRFAGAWSFDSASGELCRHGTRSRLEPQPAALLALLADRAGGIVTHDEIRRTIWGDAIHVNFRDSVHYCVRQIRAALGDRPRDPQFIETIPRRGYRLKIDAVVRDAEAPPVSLSRPPGAWRRLAAAGLIACLAATTAIVERRPNRHHEIAVSVLKTVHDFVF